LPPPSTARADKLKIFALNRKHCLSVSQPLWLDLKGLICTIDKQLYYRERQKHMQHSLAPGPIPECRAPVICKGFFPPSPLVGNERAS
jgi:hypothetical protein